MKKTRPGVTLGVLLSVTLCCVSCSSPSLNPVQGKVLYKGQPLKGAVVTFHPKAIDAKDVTTVRPVGLTNDEGVFELSTGQQKGALAGEYVVTLICAEEVAPKGKRIISTEGLPDTQDRFKGAYANPATSGLKAVIKSGPNQLDPFELK
jgi:hypothetical protein